MLFYTCKIYKSLEDIESCLYPDDNIHSEVSYLFARLKRKTLSQTVSNIHLCRDTDNLIRSFLFFDRLSLHSDPCWISLAMFLSPIQIHYCLC